MKEITASVTGQNLVLDQTVLNVAGTVNLYKLKITFDKDWENADTKIVSFANGCGKAIAVEYDETNGVTIPWEVLQAPEGQIGKVHIGVLGYAGTTLRITTTSAYEANVLIVMPASLGLEAAMTPTPDIYQKLLQAIAAEDNKIGLLANLDTDDKSNLVAAINEVLSKIEQGVGTVKSVNNIEPDDNGNITLPIPTKTNDLINNSDFQNGTQTAATANAAVSAHNESNTAHTDIREALNGKQAALSSAQLAAVNSGIDSTKVGQIATNTTNIGTNTGDIATINGKIPAQASSSNQLADKSFVNSTVQTASANFRGNWATWNAVPTDANDYPVDADGNKTPTKNDYMVVQDASGYPTSPDPALAGTWRFKYSGTWATDGKNGWHPEYQVNETPLTSDQLAALNSGITAEAVTKLGGIESGAEVNDIDSISVNGTAVTPDANKNVALTIPDGIKTLTTADYNYPTNNPTKVAIWLLDTGFYKANSGVVVARTSSQDISDGCVFEIGTPNNLNYRPFIFLEHNYLRGGSLSSSGSITTTSYTDDSGYIVDSSQIVDSVTSSVARYGTRRPLSAAQGYLLNKNAIGTTESKTIATTDWTALASSDPYDYSATVTLTATIGTNSTVELINDQAVLFGTHGFAIGSISGQNVTIYSIGQPAASVSLKINVKG